MVPRWTRIQAPNVSSRGRRRSCTVFGSASSPLTLKIMLGVVPVFLPIEIAYQLWVKGTCARFHLRPFYNPCGLALTVPPGCG